METENRSGNTGIEKPETKRARATARATADRNTNSTDTRARATGGTATGGTATGGTATGGTAEKEKIVPKVVSITPPEPKAKRTRKKAAAKKEESNPIAEQMTALIVGVSAVAARRPNMTHWLISENEAKTIAEPLSSIIEKSESLKKLTEHSDSLALTVACVTVFLPRVMITAEHVKEEKKLKKRGVKKIDTEATETKRVERKDTTDNAANGTNVSTAIFDILQPTYE